MHRGYFILFLILIFFTSFPAGAQSITGAKGTVIDAQTGETMPYVQIMFPGSTIGTMSDQDGNFEIENNRGLTTLSFQMLGYETTLMTIMPNTVQDGLTVEMSPDIYGIQAVTVTPKRRKDRAYKRRGNPAVELIRNVIARKDSNRPGNTERYKADVYEKLTMSLDKFDVDFENNRFWSKFNFIEKYVDTAKFNATPVLTVSLRETISEKYWQRRPEKEMKVVKAKRMHGVDKVLDKEGLGTSIDAMFTPVDIHDDNMEILLNRFVSPLSSSLAVLYYKYYIMDTLLVDGKSCIDLAFVPVSSESYGFTGHLYITNDSDYAVKKYSINVPPHINMNFVSDLSIEQSFSQTENGTWVPDETNTYTRFYIFKKMRQLYAHQTTRYSNYDFSQKAAFPDSLTDTSADRKAEKFSKEEWVAMRPEPLGEKETLIDSLVVELRRIPRFNSVVRTVETFVSGYVATSPEHSRSKFDFGPIYNTLSYNTVEGIRIRAGGMTTANLSKHDFFNGYIAYGCRDNRFKYGATYIHSFAEKEYHPYESLRHAIYLTSSYDMEVPGQSFSVLDRDNFLMSSFKAKPMQYVWKARLRYEKEWENRFSLDTWAEYEHNEAAGTLRYDRIGSDGTVSQVKSFNNIGLAASLRFAPGEPIYNNRLGKNSPFNLAKDAPVISLTHQIGLFDSRFFWNRTDISAEKRFWLSSFGHIDAAIRTGIVWNKVPFPKLYIPESGNSFLLSPNSFNMMSPMEFVMDRYASIFATYYLKGWIFNRIPLIKHLKLREVLSFNLLYGALSQKNNPLYGTEGLYMLPGGTRIISRMPYMEISAGIENIFKFIRIDYVRRLSYNDGLTGWQKNGIKLTFRFTL